MTEHTELLARTRSIALLFEDAQLLVVNKPAGLTVVPAREEPESHCLRALLENVRREKLWVVHRLDRDTTGVLLFARTAEAHRKLSLAFEHRETQKQYLAWLLGALAERAGVLNVPLHTARKGKMRPALPGEKDAVEAITEYEVQHVKSTRLGPCSQVVFRPRTGRQHQLRVHARSQNAPILLDPLYAITRLETLAPDALGPASPPLERIALHASSIAFAHPTLSKPISVEAPLPDELQQLSNWITKPT